MRDCWEIKQGMIFYVDDPTSSQNIVFKGEHTPKKRRPWIVVSNDRNNMYSPNVSMVPIYTRTDAKLPTQVYFKNGEREQVACCETVSCIPKHMIDTRAYIGTISNNILKQIQNALAIQFSTFEEAITPSNVETTIGNIIKSMNVENVIASKLCELLLTGLTTTIAPSVTTITNVDISGTTGDVIEEPTLEPMPKESSDSITEVSNTPKKKRNYGPRGNTMSIENCFEFYMDTETMTSEELFEKWKTFGVKNGKQEIAKKKWAIKQRLLKEGLL